jgi:sporulation protein YlmC with PRC-barrel domain
MSMDSRFAKNADERGRAAGGDYSSSGGELLHLPVCVDGAELGRPTDLLLDLDRLRVVGLNVRCGQGAERFLPLAAAELEGKQINAFSSLALLDESAYYGEHGASLRSLRGAVVDLAGRPIGTLADIVLRADGEVTRIVVRNESGKLRRHGAKHVHIRQRKAVRR